MSIFKCKMCGGTVEFEQGATVGVCDSCGTKQTLPKTNDEIIANLFNRANNLRLKCEFDKAAAIYEKIVEQDDGEAEAHWGIVLCKYGIEYVEDPKTLARIPTCHRTLFEAVTADADYQAAIDYSDASQQSIYESEARAIDHIQKDILSIVKNEKPFDIFICYKETDENGKRTIDSIIANDIYYQLTQEGFKVFYAAITLEDKLGQEYEPYIFAALNSAKVMLVLGTKPEYFSAVWVKNEWSRFMQLMKTDRSKLLIPCYRDMDAYDLPEEFAHLQAQDMGKIGFINDVVRGIKKVVQGEAKKTSSPIQAEQVAVSTSSAVAPLLKRVALFLEDGEFEKADDFCEQILNIDPECAEAYLGKLMAELHVKKKADLADCDEPLDERSNFRKAVRFANERLSAELKGLEEHNKKIAYDNAMFMMKGDLIQNFESAIKILKPISGWRDADDKIILCQQEISKIKAKAEADRLEAKRQAEERRIAAEKAKKRAKKIAAIVITIVCVVIAFAIVLNAVIIPSSKYNNAVALMNDGKYKEAIAAFSSAGSYKDASEKRAICVINIYGQETLSAGGSHTVGLKSDGTVVAIGNNYDGQCDVSSWKDIVAVSAGSDHTVGLKSDGTVVAVGSNEYGQCDVSSWKDIVAVSAGDFQTVGLKSDGTVVAVGSNEYHQCDVSDWEDIVAISAGNYHTVGLKSDGTVVAVGSNEDGQCDVSDWTDIVAVSAGGRHTVGLKSDGTVVAVGYNGFAFGSYSFSQCDVSGWKDIIAISAGGRLTVGLKSDGTVVADGFILFGNLDVSGWTDIVAVSAGGSHAVGLKSDGTVVATGNYYDGQCDVSSWSDILLPQHGALRSGMQINLEP